MTDHASTPPDTILLIHGLWMTPLCWEHWITRYSARGYRVLAPGWPGTEVDIEQLRRDASALAGLGVQEIVDHYAQIIGELKSPPILMGHSFGGAFVQLLLDRGLGAAGVAIDPAPLKGVFSLPFSTLRTSFPVLHNPANVKRTVPLTPEQFHYAFTNSLSAQESLQVYQRYAIPGPGRVLFQAALANFNPHAPTRVNFHNDARAPLLLIAGGNDHIVPASVTRENLHRYRSKVAITALKEYPDRTHYTVGQRGWEEVADYALGWVEEHTGAKAAAAAE
jgi:alpha-beta hydrolase superfamily lysophospholipase